MGNTARAVSVVVGNHISRVRVFDARGNVVSSATGAVHVRRWNNVVHIVDSGMSGALQFDTRGVIIGEDLSVAMVCGQRAKINDGGRNRYTTDGATCLTCVVGEFSK